MPTSGAKIDPRIVFRKVWAGRILTGAKALRYAPEGSAERDAALVMLEQIPGTKYGTAGGDKITLTLPCQRVTSTSAKGPRQK